MRKRENQISLDFISDLKFTEFCALVFSYIKALLNLKDDEYFQIEISLREVINNAILHGNKGDLSRRVYVCMRWNKTHLTIQIKDENTEKVDFEKVNERLAQNDLLSHNGRGLLIMKSYMDSVEFFPSEKGTEIVMVKKL